MPDQGRARHESYLIDLPKERSTYPPLPWTCANATLINVFFEVRKDPLLDRLPPEYGRTSPPYCRLTIVDHKDSPIGAFRDAYLALGCRLNMAPASFVAVSVTDNRSACAAGIAERGYPNAIGTIDFEADAHRARARISDNMRPLLEVTLPLLQAIEPSRLGYDHVDAIRTLPERKTELIVTKPDFAIDRAAICKNARVEYPVERPDTTWQVLDCRNVVSAQLVVGTRNYAAGEKLA
ncbi:MAG TPA: acetoacetate decarboxylase family protein [Candidatus Binatus sp.]|nr:acetoacetate decarboxylase family protein [Candidatus Binatus sp.]